jgi:hypothetical protein
VVAVFSLWTFTAGDFPPEYRERWEQIRAAATKCGPLRDYKGEVWRSSVENTMNHVRNATAAKIATEIHRLYWDMSVNTQFR